MNTTNRKPQGKAGEAAPALIVALKAAATHEPLAVAFFEAQRWGDHPACPRCGVTDVVQMRNRQGARNARYLWHCRGCVQQFTVRIGTVMEESRLPLKHWAYAFWRASTSKKGVSALEIARHTGTSYKSALFLMHRIRHAMTAPPTEPKKFSGIIEADETYVGGKPRWANNTPTQATTGVRKPRAPSTKTPVFAVVERGGPVHAEPMPRVSAGAIRSVLERHVDAARYLMTDESPLYHVLDGSPRWNRQTVQHTAGEYVRGIVHTNTIEGFFALVKRGLHGIFHSVSKAHLHRYLSEFAFRYSARHQDDAARTLTAIRGGNGKRLTYDAYVVRKGPRIKPAC